MTLWWHGPSGTLFLLWVVPGACISATGWAFNDGPLEAFGVGVLLIGSVYTAVLLAFPHHTPKGVPAHVGK